MGDGETRTCLVRDHSGSLRTLSGRELDKIDQLRSVPGNLVWLNVANPTNDDLRLLEREFSIHPLAMEDVRKRHQRPKVDTYSDQHMVVAYEALMPSDDAHPFELAELHFFVGSGWLVSVHWGPSPSIDDVRQRFESDTDAVGTTVGALLYSMLDAAVDTYFPVIDRLSEDINELEDRVVEPKDASNGSTLRELLKLKRELLELRRVVAPMREVANSLLRRDIRLIDDAAAPYFQDLYDHLVRVLDQLDLFRDMMAAVVDARLSVTSNSLNAIMKRLTAFTVILMVPTLIAGIYGMNFVFMPEFDWALGYPFALGLMGAAVIILVTFFRRRGWF